MNRIHKSGHFLLVRWMQIYPLVINEYQTGHNLLAGCVPQAESMPPQSMYYFSCDCMNSETTNY